MAEEFLWVEKYRPSKVSECVLPPRLKNVFQSYVDSGQIPNMLLTGTAGVGKTTVAYAMCEEVGVDYIYINASNERGIDTLRTKVIQFASTLSLLGNKKVIILDEADYMTPEMQSALRGTVEQYSDKCTFILTCNFKSKLFEAIHSRMTVLDFTLKKSERQQMAAEFFKKLEFILDAEKVKYNKQVVAKIVEKYFPDFRRTIGELQSLAKGFGEISPNVVDQLSDVRNLKELFGYLKDKKFGEIRKWLVENGDIDATKLYRKIYDGLYDILKPESIPQAVLILARYQYQSAFVADQEINTLAFLTEIMVDCEFV